MAYAASAVLQLERLNEDGFELTSRPAGRVVHRTKSWRNPRRSSAQRAPGPQSSNHQPGGGPSARRTHRFVALDPAARRLLPKNQPEARFFAPAVEQLSQIIIHPVDATSGNQLRSAAGRGPRVADGKSSTWSGVETTRHGVGASERQWVDDSSRSALPMSP